MSDPRDHDVDALDEGELLAAYLDGETDDVSTRRLERRLADDVALAARLDALAATRAQLQRLGQVEMPDDVRQRLRERLARERAPETPAVAPRTRRQRWRARFAPIAAAAAVALVAVVGLASVGPSLGGGGTEEAGESAAMAEPEAPPPELSAPAAGAAEDERAVDSAVGEEAADGTGGRDEAAEQSQDGVARAPVTVDGDAEIAARAERLLEDPPASLRTRERRLRRRAGLPIEPLCVADLEASTVDLIEEDGRVALAVLLDRGADQIVLLDPQTCAPIRTVSPGR